MYITSKTLLYLEAFITRVNVAIVCASPTRVGFVFSISCTVYVLYTSNRLLEASFSLRSCVGLLLFLLSCSAVSLFPVMVVGVSFRFGVLRTVSADPSCCPLAPVGAGAYKGGCVDCGRPESSTRAHLRSVRWRACVDHRSLRLRTL